MLAIPLKTHKGFPLQTAAKHVAELEIGVVGIAIEVSFGGALQRADIDAAGRIKAVTRVTELRIQMRRALLPTAVQPKTPGLDRIVAA